MLLKIDTKEKFHEITVTAAHLAANMTAEIYEQLSAFLQQNVKNIIFRMGQVASIDADAAEGLVTLQQHFYENETSFVICELQPAIETALDDAQLLEAMNITPTLSEAWDMVQMEEIEREFLAGDDQ